IIIQSIFITASRAKTRIVIRSTKSSPGKYLYDLNLRVWISATFTVGNGAVWRSRLPARRTQLPLLLRGATAKWVEHEWLLDHLV
ncbi:Laccase-8, partial [Frankliniella fusca]